eukprot:c9237_g1_i1.p1 GENE.c9237_g1_i1~~c9237_g1_i1.p1  ORF type:complete len:418 (-),score=113.47 c9237_g1_i1:147-1349(-)
MANPDVNVEALKSEIRACTINDKANACPMMIRLAWHGSGTFDKKDGSGGSNGATMRFEPESTDDANKGLSIVRDMLLPVKGAHPNVSYADLWTLAGSAAVEFSGGPKVPHKFGRSDAQDGKTCPANGRLPDASKGADHIREVFYRMGFNDREIVALCGAHTLGRCHLVRSGYDGPWTRNPLRFDNQFFRNLLYLEWRPRKWDGPFQYEDVQTGELMMLPTDMALKTDPEFRKYVELYAKDEAVFFEDFAKAFSKLTELGCPAAKSALPTERERFSAEFREAAMHGSVSVVRDLAPKADVHAVEKSSGRTALHKAAFWGHVDTVKFLLADCKLDPSVQDSNGDTALHDAARFGHEKVVEIFLAHKANSSIKNKHGKDVATVAQDYGKTGVVALLKARSAKL